MNKNLKNLAKRTGDPSILNVPDRGISYDDLRVQGVKCKRQASGVLDDLDLITTRVLCGYDIIFAGNNNVAAGVMAGLVARTFFAPDDIQSLSKEDEIQKIQKGKACYILEDFEMNTEAKATDYLAYMMQLSLEANPKYKLFIGVTKLPIMTEVLNRGYQGFTVDEGYDLTGLWAEDFPETKIPIEKMIATYEDLARNSADLQDRQQLTNVDAMLMAARNFVTRLKS